MKFLRISFLLAAAALALVSCKKDEDVVSKTLDGYVRLEFPEFVTPGFSKTFCIDTLMTVTRDDGGEVGYYFTTPITEVRDTMRNDRGEVVHREYTYTAPDSLGNFSLTLTAYGDDYISSSSYANFTVVRPGLNGRSSLTNFEVLDSDRTFVDTRDRQTYYYTTIGDTDWMRQNLAWAGAGHPYYDCEAMSSIFGRYYTWDEAQDACPPGWRLPTDEDWAEVAAVYGSSSAPGANFTDLSGDLMEDIYFNGIKLWEYWREVKITNDARLSVMPVGYAQVEDGKYTFGYIYQYAAFWTADEVDADNAVFRYIYEDQPLVYWGSISKSDLAFSVRCVRDAL